MKDGRVVYLTEKSEESQYWNIPIANTSVILLGTGTSITQAAVRMLSSAGVPFGFSGGGGTPLFAGTEVQWITPQSEYRPTEYVQQWMKFWFDSEKRLLRAKFFQESRLDFLMKTWEDDRDIKEANIHVDDYEMQHILNIYRNKISTTDNVGDLLATEALMTKELYKYVAKKVGLTDFRRDRDQPIDKANMFLNHGNYLAYGLAATTLWVLGIPHGFAVMHGKTRRGALVFDVADLIKDAIVLPLAFISAFAQHSDKEFRDACLQAFATHGALDFMFDKVKEAAITQVSGALL